MTTRDAEFEGLSAWVPGLRQRTQAREASFVSDEEKAKLLAKAGEALADALPSLKAQYQSLGVVFPPRADPENDNDEDEE